MSTVLVTGGAGYIGSHVVRQLTQRGDKVVVLDNLSTGFREAVIGAPLVVGDTGDMELVNRVMREHDVDSVIHFAAFTVVPESVTDPLKYYRNNTSNARNLLACCVENGINKFIFSSTAAVYGELPNGEAAREDSPKDPVNSYGRSKLCTEYILKDLDTAGQMKYGVLRYFNVAGSNPDGVVGQSTPKATLLIKVAAEVATGKRDRIYLFGTDYDTRDGTAIRDYIHVEDLADAHLKALDALRNGAGSMTLNCGYGHGFTVREVLDTVEQVSGKKLNIIESPRRAGDPPELVSHAELIRSSLGWEPRYDDLAKICEDSYRWELNKRYG